MKRSAKKIERIMIDHEFRDYKWINPNEIVVSYWVRMKCQYGCPSYAKRGCCPPETPSVGDCRRFFGEYRSGALLHFPVKLKRPELREGWGRKMLKKALALEREVFLSDFPRAFVFPPAVCRLCSLCPSSKSACRQPYLARPTLEAFAVDVYSTAHKMGYPIHVLKGYREEMNRFGLLLIE